MRSSLTLLHGTGLGFTLSHFPVLGGGGGLMHFACSCATSSLNGSLLSKSSWLLTFFNNNLINCSLVSFLRSFFYIFSIPILYDLVFKPFLGRVAISLFISILYGLVFKPFLGRVSVFISICIHYSHISLSPFGRTSLSSNDSNGISRTILTYGWCLSHSSLYILWNPLIWFLND